MFAPFKLMNHITEFNLLQKQMFNFKMSCSSEDIIYWNDAATLKISIKLLLQTCNCFRYKYINIVPHKPPEQDTIPNQVLKPQLFNVYHFKSSTKILLKAKTFLMYVCTKASTHTQSFCKIPSVNIR